MGGGGEWEVAVLRVVAKRLVAHGVRSAVLLSKIVPVS